MKHTYAKTPVFVALQLTSSDAIFLGQII